DTYWFFPSLAPNEHISRLGQVQVTGPLLTRARVQVVAGGSAHVRNITSNNLGEHDDAGAGVFTSTRWQATDALTVNASLRVDVDPAFGTEPTPQLGLAYLVSPSWIVRASGGRSVRAPNYVERYFNTELARPRGRDLGNPDLRAERAWSAEAGTDLYLPGGLDVHATVFGRRTNDLIDFALLTPADTVFRAQNLLEVDTQGFELEAALRRPLASGALLLTASLSGLDADLGAVDEQVTYKYALSNARRLWQASATYTDERASVGLKALRKELLAGGSYFIVDARTSLSLGRLGFSFEIRNLLDRAHSDVFDAPLPRRWWIAGVRIGR
ncbi:MAG: TonB-dependent receptor, partial [Bacteroidota bacterium]